MHTFQEARHIVQEARHKLLCRQLHDVSRASQATSVNVVSYEHAMKSDVAVVLKEHLSAGDEAAVVNFSLSGRHKSIHHWGRKGGEGIFWCTYIGAPCLLEGTDHW